MKEKNNQGQIEFDLIAILKTGWINRKTLVISGIVGAILGVVVSLLSLDKYTSGSVIIPNSNEDTSVNGGIASLASFAGVNLGGMSGDVVPILMYPRLVRGIPFMKEVMNSNIVYKGDSIKVIDYILDYSNHPKVRIKKYTIGLPKYILDLLQPKADKEPIEYKSDQIVFLSDEEKIVYDLLNEFIVIMPDIDEGYVQISCTMYDPIPAAQLTSIVSNLLQKRITELKIEKAKADLYFVEGRFEEAKQKFNDKQKELALFKDRNIKVATEVAKIEENKLQNDYNIFYSVYSELAKNLENARITVQEDTPVFSIIQPPVVPMEKSSMSRKIQVIIWTILGGFVGVGLIYYKEFRVIFINRWNQIK